MEKRKRTEPRPKQYSPKQYCPKQYCLIDHANKQKELARFTPFEFWTNQVSRRDFRNPAGSGRQKP